jgi:hypothetical protein
MEIMQVLKLKDVKMEEGLRSQETRSWDWFTLRSHSVAEGLDIKIPERNL